MFCKNLFLKILKNSQENTCAGFFLIKLYASNLQHLKEETPAKLFSCKFCEIFKNTYIDVTKIAKILRKLNITLSAFCKIWITSQTETENSFFIKK